jgi:hypothetical protein
MRVGGKFRAPAALLPRKGLRARLIGGCMGPRWVGKISPPTAFEPRTVQPVESRCIDQLSWPTLYSGQYLMKTWSKGEPVRQERHGTD